MESSSSFSLKPELLNSRRMPVVEAFEAASHVQLKREVDSEKGDLDRYLPSASTMALDQPMSIYELYKLLTCGRIDVF